MRLVPARPSDAVSLGRIMGGWSHEIVWMPKVHTREDDVRHVEMMIARFDVTVVRDWRGAQGFLARDGAQVQALYLAPRVRGQGLGKRLIAHAKAAGPWLQLWTFQANLSARRFYAREGFAEVEWTDGAENDEKLPDVRLVWPAPEEAT